MPKVKEKIRSNLEKNGFPKKRVTLPFRPVFEACRQEEVKLSQVLKELSQEGIFHEMQNDKILFHDGKETNKSETPIDKGPFGLNNPLYAKAMEQMKNLNPDSFKELSEKMKNMSAEERDRLLKMAQEIMKKSS